MSNHFEKVLCREELPKETRAFDTDRGLLLFSEILNEWVVSKEYEPIWWLKMISLEDIKEDVWDEGFTAAYEFYPIYEDLPDSPINPYRQWK